GPRRGHRLAVGALEAVEVAHLPLPPRDQHHLPAAALVAANLLAQPLPHSLLTLGDMDAGANRPAPETRVLADPVADEDADQPGRGPVDRRRIGRRLRCAVGARIAVRPDRVQALG